MNKILASVSLLILFVVSLPVSGHAYRLYQIKWPTVSFDYFINQTGVDDAVDYSAKTAMITAAADVWTGVATSNLQVNYQGTTADQTWCGDGAHMLNGQNTITWKTWAGSVMAVASVWSSGGDIIEADIKLNTNYADDAKMAVQIMHEVGSCIGIAHTKENGETYTSSEYNAVMYWTIHTQTGLNSQDKCAVTAIYPADPAACSPTFGGGTYDCLPCCSTGNEHTWTGLADTTHDWSDATRWNPSVPDEHGDIVVFDSGMGNRAILNVDVDPGVQLRFRGDDHTFSLVNINGNALTIGGDPSIDMQNWDGDIYFNNALSFGGDTSFRGQPFAGTINFRGLLTNNGHTLTVTAGDIDIEEGLTGTGGLTITGGEAYIYDDVDYSGPTTVTGGKLRMWGHNLLPAYADITLNAPGKFDLEITAQSIDKLSGDGTVESPWGNAYLTVGADGGTSTFSGNITNPVRLTKTGAGTFTLAGANTYTASTTISGGTLELQGAMASTAYTVNGGTLELGAADLLPDTSTVTVAVGAAFNLNDNNETIGTLKGSGSAPTGTGMLTVATGLAPGDSPGTISTGNITLANTSTLTCELDGTTPGTDYDRVVVTGTVTLDSPTLALTLGYSPAGGDSFVIIDNDGIDAVTGTFSGLTEGAIFTVGGTELSISYAAGDGNDVVVSAVTTFDVAKTGSGTGTVASTPAGIDCGADCSETYLKGTAVTLSATADADSDFAGWSGGGCSGTGDCAVTMNTDMGVTATFNLKTYSTSFSAGTGGSLTGTTSQTITIGSDCTALSAAADEGFCFHGWTGTGGFTSTENPLTVTAVTQDMTIAAEFGRQVVYVDGDDGDDAAGDGSRGAPYASIQKALEQGCDGGTLYVYGGTYAPFTVARPLLSLKAAAGESPVVSGTGIDYTDGQGKTSKTGILIQEDDCTLEGFTPEGTYRSGVAVDGAHARINFNNLGSGTLEFGIENVGGSPADALNNWWGSETGPSGGETDACDATLTANGSGTRVSEDVCFSSALEKEYSGTIASHTESTDQKLVTQTSNPDSPAALMIEVAAAAGVTVTRNTAELATYSENPAATFPYGFRTSGAQFFDVYVPQAGATSIQSLTIRQCEGVDGYSRLRWHNGSDWVETVPGAMPRNGCLEMTITGETEPAISDLTGSFFMAGKLTSSGGGGWDPPLLYVIIEPEGGGLVTSLETGDIYCPEECLARIAYGLTVTLEATAAPGYAFDSWQGCAAAEQDQCTVTMKGNQVITAGFKEASGNTTTSIPSGSDTTTTTPAPDQTTTTTTLPVTPTSTTTTGMPDTTTSTTTTQPGGQTTTTTTATQTSTTTTAAAANELVSVTPASLLCGWLLPRSIVIVLEAKKPFVLEDLFLLEFDGAITPVLPLYYENRMLVIGVLWPNTAGTCDVTVCGGTKQIEIVQDWLP